MITNQAGSLVEATSYDPYGRVLSGGTVSKYGYTGQEKDSETGLNYYDSRYYGSDIRRFVQPDTWLPDMYDPQQLNRYSYANNNPLRYTDPTGHCSKQAGKGGLGAFFASCLNTFGSAVNSLVQQAKVIASNVNKLVQSKLAPEVTKQIQSTPVKINNQKPMNTGTGTAAKTNLTGTGSTTQNVGTNSKINITPKGLNHVMSRHIEGGIKSMGKSIFSNPDEVTTLIQNAEKAEPILQANGNLLRTVDAGKIVGVDIITGQSTTFYTVVTTGSNLVTAHPGLPK